MKFNMVWDGVFHALTWLMVVAGLWRLWSAGKRTDVAWSTRTLLGGLFLGWGLFNLVEGIIDHELLGLHHVHPGPGQGAWDVAFLVLGACLIGVGWLLKWLGRADSRPRGAGTGHSVSRF